MYVNRHQFKIDSDREGKTQMAGLGGGATVEYVEATHLRLVEDAIVFAERSFETTDDVTANRFARSAALCTCLYLESLSNLVLEKLEVRETALVDRLVKGGATSARLDVLFDRAHARNMYEHPRRLAAIAAIRKMTRECHPAREPSVRANRLPKGTCMRTHQRIRAALLV